MSPITSNTAVGELLPGPIPTFPDRSIVKKSTAVVGFEKSELLEIRNLSESELSKPITQVCTPLTWNERNGSPPPLPFVRNCKAVLPDEVISVLSIKNVIKSVEAARCKSANRDWPKAPSSRTIVSARSRRRAAPTRSLARPSDWPMNRRIAS